MKTWRSLVLVMRGHETKTNYILSINTCKIFFQPLDVEERAGRRAWPRGSPSGSGRAWPSGKELDL